MIVSSRKITFYSFWTGWTGSRRPEVVGYWLVFGALILRNEPHLLIETFEYSHGCIRLLALLFCRFNDSYLFCLSSAGWMAQYLMSVFATFTRPHVWLGGSRVDVAITFRDMPPKKLTKDEEAGKHKSGW